MVHRAAGGARGEQAGGLAGAGGLTGVACGTGWSAAARMRVRRATATPRRALHRKNRLANVRGMIKRMASGLVLAVSLAGWAQAADLPARAPGLWRSSTSVTGPDGQTVARDVVTLTCIDPATDQAFLLSGQSRCSKLNISGAGADYKINGTCAQPGGTVTIDETLHYASHKDVQLKADVHDAAGEMSLTSALQWQGVCLPGMQPGDEGREVNGAFVKTGNINDPQS